MSTCRVKDALQNTRSFQIGDSADQLTRGMWKDFFERMDQAIEGNIKWTLILSDPLDNSFIAPRSIAETDSEDPNLKVEQFTRTAEEDAEFGIDHLREHGTGLESKLEDLNTVDWSFGGWKTVLILMKLHEIKFIGTQPKWGLITFSSAEDTG